MAESKTINTDADARTFIAAERTEYASELARAERFGFIALRFERWAKDVTGTSPRDTEDRRTLSAIARELRKAQKEDAASYAARREALRSGAPLR